jgi:argininosuccinate lyase
MKLWSGRFERETDELADEFNSSLPFDKKLYRQDIEGSIAHCKMLGACGIIPDQDADRIAGALQGILEDIESGKLEIGGAEDIHTFVETELIKRIGDVGKKLHTARSRNDQVATDLRMYMKGSVSEICSLLQGLIERLLKIARENADTIMPGFTHLQKAQPITLAHHLAAYCEMFLRDIERFTDCKKRIDVMPLGSCALAATTHPIDRKMTAALLSFGQISNNSLDAVSDRDFAIEFLFCCCMVSMHLSRLCEEFILWSTEEFSFINIDDAFATGSSIMPQKKNPDMAELIRGKTGRVYGNLLSLLTMMKALPLAYNKDMQEDKNAVFNSEETIKKCLKVMAAMLPAITFNRRRMRAAAKEGYTVATDVADYLVKKGMPFRKAHEVTGTLVLYCSKKGIALDKLTIDEFKSFSKLFEKDILDTIKLENAVKNRSVHGGPAKKEVKRQLSDISKRLNQVMKKIY